MERISHDASMCSVVHWLSAKHVGVASTYSVGIYTGHGYYLDADKPSRYIPNHLGQLSLPSLRCRLIEYQLNWLELRGTRLFVLGGR